MKINSFIICDDIRSEVGNKKSLMGLYTKELVFSVTAEEAGVWPKDLVLGMMLDFSISAELKRRHISSRSCIQYMMLRMCSQKGSSNFLQMSET